jgi:hypothetical protein
MEIYQKPTFIAVSGTYYRKSTGMAGVTNLGIISNIAIYASQGRLEQSQVGISYTIYIPLSSLNFTVLLDDYIKINSQSYQIISDPLYQKGNSVLQPYYKLNVKTISQTL